MKTFTVDIYTPSTVVVQGLKVDSLIIPTAAGQLNILPEHMQLMTKLDQGILVVTHGKQKSQYSISFGVMNIQGERISILSKLSKKILEE